MSVKPRPSRPRHKPRPKSRPRLFMPLPLPLPQASVRAHWAPQQVTLEELLLDYSLPQLVQCKTPGLRAHDGRPVAIPLDKPILLADQRSARHLLARIVQYDHRTKTFNESADSVVIPEDYEGHFLRLQSRTTKDKTHVKSLQTIAHDDTPAFLNLSDITSFPAGQRDHPHDQSYFIHTVGNVFLVDESLPSESMENPQDTVSMTNQDTKPVKDDDSEPGKTTEKQDSDSTENQREENTVQSQSATTNGSHPSKSTSTITSSGRNYGNGLMKCLDERGMAVMVPTNQVGEMVTVQKNGDHQPKLSVRSSDMIANEQFPLLARYAYGKRHPRLTAFTKLLTLLDSFQETSIIACIIDNASVMLMEIPVTSSLQFQVALNFDDLVKVPRIRNALEACRTQGKELAKDIKFKYKFSHRVQESSRRMMKLKEDDLPSATVRIRLVVTETYVYI